MQERQVTTDGITHRLPAPFFVIATQNPIEYEGTYPLPEAQLDRFLLRTAVGYPDAQTEWEMLEQRIDRGADEVALRTVVTAEELVAMQRSLENVHVSETVGRYVVDIVGATRESAKVEVGASPRGSLAVMKLSRAQAALSGREYVTPDDVKAVAVPALAHRLVLRTELWVRRVRPESVIEEIVASVPTPPAEDLAPTEPAETTAPVDPGEPAKAP